MLKSNLKKIMEEKGETIRGLAAKAKVSDRTILSARGDDISKCRLYTLEAIARCLGCKVKDLFDEED